MQCGKRCWGHAPTAAVRSDLVVVTPPCGNGLAGLLQGLKPVLIEALISEGAVEAFDVRVLGWAARFDQDVFDAVLLRPRHECPAGELRAVVGSDLLGVTPKRGCPVQQARHVSTAHAEVCGDVHALVAEVIRNGQALDAP